MSVNIIPEKTQNSTEFLTIMIAQQRFGIPILQVQDVLGQQSVTKIPLSSPEVAGSLNLRGRIVTAIDVRKRLSMKANNSDHKKMSVVVEHEHELYSLIIDKVGDVLNLNDDTFENTPATIDPVLRDLSLGIHRLENDLLVILDVPKLLDTMHE